MTAHKWIKSNLGHGNTMCEHCKITDAEAAVLGLMNECDKAPKSEAKAMKWKLVPVEPTPEMLETGLQSTWPNVWGNMLAASPAVPDEVLEEVAKRLYWTQCNIMHDHEKNWRNEKALKGVVWLDCARAVLTLFGGEP